MRNDHPPSRDRLRRRRFRVLVLERRADPATRPSIKQRRESLPAIRNSRGECTERLMRRALPEIARHSISR
jgi:hypothetical protein